MSDELAAWLQVREGADWQARSARLAGAAAHACVRAPNTALEVLDLGTGAGSNLRYLAPRLGVAHQRWTVVDRSDVVLQHLVARTMTWAATDGLAAHAVDGGCVLIGADGRRWEVRTLVRDLDTLDAPLFAGRHLVTASALLDLVSDAWLEALAGRCRDAGASAFFALTYDGRFSCDPEDPDDAVVREHFNRHQHTDKGLGGVAAGPDATACAVARLAAVGYRVDVEQTDWVIGPEAVVLQRALVDGWAYAAAETAPALTAPIAAWKARRLADVEARRSRLRVGHHDLLAAPR